MNDRLKGLGVALVTPFKESGEVDFGALERLVDYVSQGGVNYLVVMGTTGETSTLNSDEKHEVLACVKKQNKGKLPIVVGIGGNDTRKVVEMIEQTDLEGVDAILSVTPYYNRPSQKGLFEHYKYIAEKSPIPIILYNVPSRTGVNMRAETTLLIARKVPNVIAVKEASGTIEQIEQIIKGRPEGFGVLSGDDAMALALIKAGGEGLISVAANAFPNHFSQMIVKQIEGDSQAAEEQWQIVQPVVRMLFDEGNPPGVKAALTVLKVTEEHLRLPLTKVTNRLYNKIQDAIKEKKLK